MNTVLMVQIAISSTLGINRVITLKKPLFTTLALVITGI